MKRPSRLSQSGKILAYLEHGGWWKCSALLHYVPCVVHSRVAELRKYGYMIEHRTTGPGASGSEYRLATADDGGGAELGAALWTASAPPSSAAVALGADALSPPLTSGSPPGASAPSASVSETEPDPGSPSSHAHAWGDHGAAPPGALDLNQLSLLEVA